MSNQQTIDTAAIAALEQQDIEQFRRLTMRERGELLAAVCRAVAKIEASRIKMGMPPSQPAPWPESTRKFFIEAARRVRERTASE